MKKQLKFREISVQLAAADPTPTPALPVEPTNLIVSLALRWSRTAEIEDKDDKELFAEIDLYLGDGIVSVAAIKLVIALARLCRKVQDGKSKKAVIDYLNRRLQIAMFHYAVVGRDLLKTVAEKVIADEKLLDQRSALRRASAKALRK